MTSDLELAEPPAADPPDPAVTGSSPAPSAPRPRRRRHAPWWHLRRLRVTVQLATLAVVIWIGAGFAVWVRGLEQGQAISARPPGVEGFLPISALISLRAWMLSGEASRIHPAGLVILLLAIGTALLLKKGFCAWLCPVGTLAEWLGVAGRRLHHWQGRLPAALDYPLRSLKYLLLAFFVLAIFVQMGPRELQLFLESPYNKVADVKMLYFFTRISPLAFKVMLGLVVVSLVVPFFWCRFLCPYGALLGLVSIASPLKVTRTPSRCTDCGTCSKVCPALLPVATGKRVWSPECTGCLDCVAACPAAGALEVTTPAPWRRAVRPAIFAALVVALFFGGIGVAKRLGFWQTSLSRAEYVRRVGEIDHPKYHHARGQVPAYGPAD